MLELKNFQTDAAHSIANRYAFYANHPFRPAKGNKPRPFFQALSALTGAGKTPILAEAVVLLCSQFAQQPIIFWMSKAKSVVAQTYANFSGGGKYSEIIEGFRVINMAQLTPALIADGSTPLMVLATTGLFNNKDQAAGALNIYKQGQDQFGDGSPWQRLIERASADTRRPLLIVYDEGHNLSEQQADILAELEPDAYLLASATLRLPEGFSKSVIQRIQLWVDDAEDDVAIFQALSAVDSNGRPNAQQFITTAVDSQAVVEAQLVKRAIQFDGTTAAMETCLDELMARMNVLREEISIRGLSFSPKAIYVCKTNIADDGEKDDHGKPFDQRQAPPIRIWRYLVESKGIDPKTIAIYANLAFLDGNKPDAVNLYSKGENDFDEFTAGDYKHIIFNQALQEGWDDPGCYLAYIDKSMGSTVQVEQIIGRVLRQYGAQHYDNPLLNSAHFFLRVDKKTVFEESIAAVKTKLQREGAPFEIITNYAGAAGGAIDIYPKDVSAPLCIVHANGEAACERIAEIVGEFTTYVEGGVDTVAEAHSTTALVELDNPNGEGIKTQWVAAGTTNPVRLRWFTNAAVRSRSKRALGSMNLDHKKFDVRAQVQSNAHKAAEKLGAEIASTYFELTDLVYESDQPFIFGTMRVPKNAEKFDNGLYERYSGFNKLELPFAHALDSSGHTWHRNPSNGGFHIPLLSEGETANFFPDFIVWKGGKVFCLDTKGTHLLSDAVARKLFDIHEDGKIKLQVRFITEGNQTELRGKSLKGGFTVWKMKAGSPSAVHVDDLDKAIKECLK